MIAVAKVWRRSRGLGRGDPSPSRAGHSTADEVIRKNITNFGRESLPAAAS
jgi:hypothetical protein